MVAAGIDQALTRSALTRAADRVVQLIRTLSVSEGDRRVPGGDWTAGQTAVHLVVVFRAFTDAAAGHEERWLPYVPDIPDWHARLVMVNERAIREVQQEVSEGLADRLAAGVHAFLTVTDRRSGEDRLTTPWYGEDVTHPLDAMTCLVLGELILHGLDIARAVGRPWPIDPEDARLIIRGVFPAMIPLVARPGVIDDRQASYDICVRGGPRLFIDFDHGKVRVQPFSAQRVDCHILSDPVTWLLVGYGRISQWGPIARGRLWAWGRKPWLGPRFKSLLHNP